MPAAGTVEIVYTLMDDATDTLTGFPKAGNRSVGGGNPGDAVRITALGYLNIDQDDPLNGTFTIEVTLDGNDVAEFEFIMDDFDTDEGYPPTVIYYLTALLSYRVDGWNGGGMILFNNGVNGASSNFKPAFGGAGTIDVKGVQGTGVGSTLVINQCVIEYLWSPP
jgi:hypothetical protein